MENKKLTIIAIDQKIADGYKEDIENFFEETLEVEAMSLERNAISKKIETDIILISTYSIFRLVKQYAPKDCEIIKINRTLRKKGYEKIKELPVKANALLVNVGPITATETISLLYNIGRKDIELYPYYPEIKEYPKLDLAITPGELKIIPRSVKTIIDIGNRVTDVSTILNIITNLKLNKEKYKKKILDYYKETIPANYGIRHMVAENYKLENQLDMLFENLNEGIITYDEKGVIIDSSNSASKLIIKDYQNIVGKKVTNILSINDKEVHVSNTVEKVIKINGNDIIATIIPAKKVGLNDGGIIILKKFSDVERKMLEHRKLVIGKGHRSKYTLNDVIGSSSEIKKCKQIAIRMARSDSTVLITGESGTGKELFAHIIHNNSKRRDNQFVAVNCSSFPENLLESELFGYEDGAFTGARKGGKQGLFEISHGGTLFLDEIGEMPMHLQNRLLRVLQEQEVMRIGGDNVMHIDVRIIAATNIDLEKRIKEKKFRKDLFYRLSVLPLNIPSLRERRDDIFEIFEYYRRKYKGKFRLSDEAENFLKNYNWDGNIRELKNYIEYFANLDKLTIGIDDIPSINMKDQHVLDDKEGARFLVESKANYEEEINNTILKTLYTYHRQKKKIGRKQMSIELEKQNIFMSEQEVRNHLKVLEHYGYVDIGKGRAGTKITAEGVSSIK